MEGSQVKVGDHVVYHDPKGQPHNALVTAAWSPICINIVFVNDDESMTDPYGRQLAPRVTSLMHGSVQSAHGNYWRRESEAPNPYVEPVSV